jgi:hypothetical protein
MVYERGGVPPQHPSDRPRLPFSWKAVALALLAALVLATPLLVIWATKGFG